MIRSHRPCIIILLSLHSFCAESSILNGTTDANYFSFQNETISDTLLDKFSNMTTTQNHLNDRIITRITIVKDNHVQHMKASNSAMGTTLGISVVQGSDNNVYVKDLMKHGPGERNGVLIGDQVRRIQNHLQFVQCKSVSIANNKHFSHFHNRYWL